MQKLIPLIVLFLMISSTPVFAQENLTSQILTLNTDKEAYYDGDVITITGQVTKVISGEEIILQIFFGKNLIGIDQVSVTQDGEFTKTIRTGGPLWQNEGSVVIKITYGKESTEATFQFFKQTGTDFASIYEVDIPDGGTFDIEYTMKGGVVDSMTVNPHSLSLDIGILTNSDGALDISIPRNALDSIDEKSVPVCLKNWNTVSVDSLPYVILTTTLPSFCHSLPPVLIVVVNSPSCVTFS